jgi:nickel-dependent lactate racemase
MEAAELVREWLHQGGTCELTALNAIRHRGRFYGIFSGPLLETLDALGPVAAGVFGRPVERPSPLVVCLVDEPLDRDLYQALKAFENWKTAVADGGVLILAADCRAGMGPPSFHQFLQQPPPLKELSRRAEHDYLLGDHKIFNFQSYLETGRSLLVVSKGPLPRERIPIRIFDDLSGAVAAAEAILGRGPAEALVIEDAGHLFPLRIIHERS